MYIFDNVEKDKIVCEKIIESSKKKGIEKLFVYSGRSESHELNVHANNIDLFRTTFTEAISITGYIGHKKGSITVNNINLEEIEGQLQNLKKIIESSFEDNANELAPFEGEKEFFSGNINFSKEELVKKFSEFIENSRKKYPILNFEDGTLDYSRGYSFLVTSNGTKFFDKSGKYSINISYSSKENENVSSFNFFSYSKKDLSKPILEWEDIDNLLNQSTQQIKCQNISEKFEGTIIFTPNSVFEMLGFLLNSLSDRAIISGTSIYKEEVGNLISSDILTIEANPLSDLFVTNSFYTSDGFLTAPMNIIENGVLKTLLLCHYGSLKTGKPRAKNYGNGIIVKGKASSLNDIIKSTKKGILLSRLSGGEVSPNGDFSGVAKNSYFIKEGQILFPIKETMVSGNFASLLKNISGISSETINDGYNILPYIKAEGIIISGK